MVLQRDKPVTVWGWADEDKPVRVSFAGQMLTVEPGKFGAWSVTLEPLQASVAGRDLVVVSGTDSMTVRDVVVGDVWHASGQSNMDMKVGAVATSLPETLQHILEAINPGIRFRRISESESATPQPDLSVVAGWMVSSPNTVTGFSAAAYYFARRLNAVVGVPIGIIDSSRGGTPIEPFIPRVAFQAHPTLQRELQLGDEGDLLGIWKLPGGVRARDSNWLPGRLFHSRLAPIDRFAVRGAIWYQGESNCGDGEDPRDYQYKMKALISGWRSAMGNADLSFYFVQLPGSGAREGWPYLREQQRLCADVSHAGMVVTIDLLNNDIHPPNKIDVGERLAAWALAKDYGRDVPFSGPLFERVEFSNDRAVVHFRYADNGLMVAVKSGTSQPKRTSETTLSHFELADKSGQWFPAQAEISGRTLVVRSNNVVHPAAVRYGYEVDPQHCHLYNTEGLPASPFCSDDALLTYKPELPVE